MKAPQFACLLLVSVLTLGACIAEDSETDEATHQEYVEMSRSEQRELIFAVKDKVIARIGESDPERTQCLTELFGDSDKGDEQYWRINGILILAAERKVEQSTRELAERVIAYKLCRPIPPGRTRK